MIITRKLIILSATLPLWRKGLNCLDVRERKSAYCGFDLSLREHARIEGHLAECRACRAEYAMIRNAANAEWASQAVNLGLNSPEQTSRLVLARIKAKVAAQEAYRTTVWPATRAKLVIAACLLIITAPLSVYLAIQSWSVVGKDGQLPPEALLAAADSDALAKLASLPSDSKASTKPDTSTTPPASSGIEESLDAIVTDIFIKAEVGTELPHTEDEYEAWAREEYPHIMWLHDLLTDPENGIDWQPAPIQRSEDPSRPDERFTQASLGWRKLLIDSGEVLKFDFPDDPEKLHCVPSIEGLQLATAIAGYGLELTEDGPWLLPELDYAEGDLPATRIDLYRIETLALPALANLEIPADYAMTLSKNTALTQSTLKYLCVSSRLANLPALESLSAQVCDARVMLASAKGQEVCDTDDWRHMFRAVLEARNDVITNLNKGLRVARARLSGGPRTVYSKSTAVYSWLFAFGRIGLIGHSRA